MGYENLLVEDRDEVTWVTLNRPERRNALSLALMKELIVAVREATGRVIVVGGAGPCFSAGHDLSEMVGQSSVFYARLFDVCTELMEAIQDVAQPVIARVHGVATAAGCQLVASCDLAVAEEGARFATPGVKIGLFCSTPMVPLTRAVGRKRAMQMLLTGDFVDASTAADWGLVNEVVPVDQLDERVAALARRVSDSSPLTVEIGKRTFYRQIDLDQRQAYDLARSVMALNAMASDAQEGMGAFLEKRPPHWTGS
ncbi:MAG TPA: enoyl-CoA hydratase [Acidimicrobiales bacterium]|nr:enoyl-CoA hydratase [Acidimicrobiales bacterium]